MWEEPTVDSSTLQREDREKNMGMGKGRDWGGNPRARSSLSCALALEQSKDMPTSTFDFAGPCSQLWRRTSVSSLQVGLEPLCTGF